MKEVDLGELRIRRDGIVVKPGRSAKSFIAGLLWVGAGAIAGAMLFVFMPQSVRVEPTQVVSAWPSQQFQLLNATGYVVAERKAAVAPRGTGRVVWLGVNEGDPVKAGAVVARLESNDVEASYQAAIANSAVAAASLSNAQSELEDASRNLGRQTALFDKRLVPLVSLQDAQLRKRRADVGRSSSAASLVAAKANERNALSAVENTQIRAPFDGIVIARAANVGDVVTPLAAAADAKGAILTIADMSTLQVEAEVSESALAQIRVGQPCELYLDAFPDRRFRGKVAVIVPAVNRASATVTTKIRFVDRDPGVLPDMSARVAFLSQPVPESDRHPVMAVSPRAISQQGGRNEVFRITTDGVVRSVTVAPGRTLGEVREIRGPLKVGDVLAVIPAEGLPDGARVRLRESK